VSVELCLNVFSQDFEFIIFKTCHKEMNFQSSILRNMLSKTFPKINEK
jgi:hypothetical protein